MLQTDVARALNEIADMHDVLGDTFRPRSYRRAARSIENSSADLLKLMESGKLATIPGVGKNIASKIEEFIQTGKIGHLEKLRRKVPSGVAQLLNIPDVGPKTALMLHRELGINSIDDLENAIEEHRLRPLKGMGEKTEENILRGIRMVRGGTGRMILGRALPIATRIRDYIGESPDVEQISLAGSIRRMKETVGDIDVLVTTQNPSAVAERFVTMPWVRDVLVSGDTKSSVILEDNLQADLRIVPDDCFGAALQYFTGSKDHNIKLREIAQRCQLKLSEYGLFDANGRKVAGRTEDEIYRRLGMNYVEPELRENTGEIDASTEGILPGLVGYDEILGDYHVHSSWSDGRHGIAEIAEAARNQGYEFVCITDHSKTLQIAHGLSEEDLLRQVEEISRLNSESGDGPRIVPGVEVDIRSDGSLDTDDEVLDELGVVIGSVHSGFKSDEGAMTKRIVDAISTGSLDVLGHPTGRIIGKRDPYPFDEDEVFDAAQAGGTMMEINAFPDRLDLDDKMARRAKRAGLKLAIGTDAHDVDQMRYMQFGVSVARRAWLGKEDLANCSLPWSGSD
jgi:DNA polymerase (family 10)